jgi:hypothetical protein
MRSYMSLGWHRQAQLGDGFTGTDKTIAKAFGLDDATRRFPES